MDQISLKGFWHCSITNRKFESSGRRSDQMKKSEGRRLTEDEAWQRDDSERDIRLQAQNDADAIFQFFHQRRWQRADFLPERLVGNSDHLA